MSILAENVLFLASGSFAVESTFDPDRSVDWEPCTVAIIHLAPFRAAMYLVNSLDRRNSFASEVSADWLLTEVNDPHRLMSWEVGSNRYRVHISSDNRILFLSLVIGFTACLARATEFRREFEDRVVGYLHTLPADLSRAEGLVINERGRLEQVACPFVLQPPPAHPPAGPPSPPRSAIHLDDEENME